jgi:hypothetical protein
MALQVLVSEPEEGEVVAMQWVSPDVDIASLLLSPSLTGRRLVLRPDLPQGVYVFVLVATATSSVTQGQGVASKAGQLVTGAAVPAVSARATVTVVVNGRPENGFVAISPTTGSALVTEFTVSTGGWVDDVEVRVSPTARLALCAAGPLAPPCPSPAACKIPVCLPASFALIFFCCRTFLSRTDLAT